jgi:hypothetical protein
MALNGLGDDVVDDFNVQKNLKIGLGNASKVLDVSSTTSGILLPRMTTSQRNAMTAIAGEMIYNVTTNKHQGYNGTIWNDFY